MAKTRSANTPAQIRCYPDGPILVRGDFVIDDAVTGPIDTSRAVVALCRCARTRTAPLCDGSHLSRSKRRKA